MPRIYVASLSDYNAGGLHGVWIDLDGIDADEVWEQINTMLAASPEAARGHGPSEEWAIHDHEGFASLRIGEYADIAKLVDIAEAMEDHPPAAVAAYIDNVGWDYFDVDAFQEAYRGCYTSVVEYASELADDMIACRFDNSTSDRDWVEQYFDYEQFANDLVIGGDIWVHEESYDSVHIFNNY